MKEEREDEKNQFETCCKETSCKFSNSEWSSIFSLSESSLELSQPKINRCQQMEEIHSQIYLKIQEADMSQMKVNQITWMQ